MIRPAIASAAAVSSAGAVALLMYDLGHFSMHMMLHIASMNVVAPLVAALIIVRRRPGETAASSLWIATLIQIVLLWAWHSPAVHDAVARSHTLGFVLHGALFLTALFFWFFLLTISTAARWQAIPALLLTGKLACLLSALLIFAPRTLYSSAGHLAHAAERAAGLRPLDDQQLAGLLMITACPLSYLVAAVVIAVQLIGRPEALPANGPRRHLSVGG